MWVNEIHVSGSRTRVGNARRFTLDGQWDRWGTFGGSFRRVDRNFQTLTSPVVNQDREEVVRIRKFEPFESHALVRQNQPVQNDHTRGSSNGPIPVGLAFCRRARKKPWPHGGMGSSCCPAISPNLPALVTAGNGPSPSPPRTKTVAIGPSIPGSMDYTLPGRLDIVPGKKFTFRPLPDTVFVKYTRSMFTSRIFRNARMNNWPFPPTRWPNETPCLPTPGWTNKATSGPAGWGSPPGTAWCLTPNYSQRRVGEQRNFSEDELAANPGFSSAVAYDKSFSQTRGLAGSWRIFSWLEPRMTWSQTGTETNGLPTASSPTAVNQKTLDRTASGDLFLSLAPRDLFPKLKVFKSLNMDGSFRVESSDNYSGVPKDFSDWRQPELFKVAHVNRRDGSKMFGLLSPLEFEDASARRTSKPPATPCATP
jgi:hypothetical protein